VDVVVRWVGPGSPAPHDAKRLELLGPALSLRDHTRATDSDPWLYAVLKRVEHAGDAYVGGLGVASLAPQGQPGASLGYGFRTPFAWDSQYDGYYFELFGLVLAPQTDASKFPPEILWPMTIDRGPEFGAPQLAVLALRCARVMKLGVPIFGRAEWRPDYTRVEYSYVGVTPGAKNDTRVAEDGLRLLQGMRLNEGGRPEGSYDYESDEDYARAIHERIYDRPDRNRALEGAATATVACWLGISESGLTRYKGRFNIGIRDIRRRRVPRPI